MLNRFKSVLYGTTASDNNNSPTTSSPSSDGGGEFGDPVFGKRIRNVIKRSTSFQEILSRAHNELDTNNDPYSRHHEDSKMKLNCATKDDSSLIKSIQREQKELRRYPYGELMKESKFHYSRPSFLQLKTEDEILVSADHQIRPIIVPRDSSKLPWKSGYAECINAGKSSRNEDQAANYQDVIVKRSSSVQYNGDSSLVAVDNQIPWFYFGIFDGHAGSAVAVAAAMQLHNKIGEKLSQISDLLVALDAKDVVEDEEGDDGEESEQDGEEFADCQTQEDEQQPKETNGTKSTETIVTSRSSEEKGNFVRHSKSNNNLSKSLETIYESTPEPEKDDSASSLTNNKKSEENKQTNGSDKYAKEKEDNLMEEKIIKEQKEEIKTPIKTPTTNTDYIEAPLFGMIEILRNNITVDKLIVGSLESAFWEMDQLIADDKAQFRMAGGCTAIVSLFILGKLYVCNAGDSRAIVYKNNKVIPMSFDFTPVSEKDRILKLGLQRPDFLGTDFTHLEFLKRPTRRDLGKQMLYKDAYMTGWSMKTITYDDLKFPLVWGEGKRSRVLATIGVTRGFGDHELRAQYGSVLIKPFLTPEPEVKILSLEDEDENLGAEDVLIMGTDGLWDVTTNEEAASIVKNSFELFPDKEESRSKYRYITAAQDLVIHSRGQTTNWNNIWRTNNDKLASLDDIAVFVIPLKQYRDEYIQWKRQRTEAIKLRSSIRRQRGRG